jgi:hypothetical protein
VALLTTMLESTASLYRPKVGQDTHRGTTQDFSVPKATGLPCSQQQASSRVQLLYGQRNDFVDTTVFFARDPGAEPNDLLIVTHCTTGRVSKYLVRGGHWSDAKNRVFALDVELIRQPI